MKKILLLGALAVAALSGVAQDIPHNLSPADKVYGLSKFWEEVNYNFVYLDKIDRQAWDSTYKAMISQVQQTPNDYEYYRLLERFCGMLKDGHTNIFVSEAIGPLLFGKMFGKYWFSLDEIGGKAIVNRTLRTIAAEIPVGTEVIAVNGIPTRQYAKDSVEPYIASSTDYYRERASIQNLLAGVLGQPYDVQFKRPDGKIFSLRLTHARTTDTTFFPPFTKDPLLTLKWYPGGIAYLALNGFDNPAIDMQFVGKLPELYKAKGLIVDLRNNGGGSTGIGTFILHYLTNDTILQHSRYYTRQHRPAYKAWGAAVKPKDTVGNAEQTELWLSYTYPDGSMFVGVGVKPEIAVYPSIQDLMTQKDLVLERALAYLKGKL